MTTLYEKYNVIAQADGTYSVYDDGGNDYRLAHSFKCAINNDISAFKLYLIRVGACAGLNVTLALQEADAVTGKPSGVDLLTKTLDATTIAETVDWILFTFAATRRASTVKYCFVVRMDGGDGSNYIGVRYDGSSPTYGGDEYSLISSDDGAVTWVIDTDKDVLFEQYGEEITTPGTVEELVLTPGGVGDYTQLSPKVPGGFGSRYNNYQMVDDPAGAADEHGSYVMVDFEHFLTGICTWFQASKNLLGDVNTVFNSELAEGYYVTRSQSSIDPGGETHNFFGHNACKVSSIQDDQHVTLVWNHTYPGRTAPQFIPGTWANGRVITGEMDWQKDKHHQYGVGTTFTTELVAGGRVRAIDATGNGHYLGEIIGDLHLRLSDIDGYSGGRSIYSGATEKAGIAYAPEGEDIEGYTRYSAPVKKDSYLLKTTRSKGDIQAVKVKFRLYPYVGVYHAGLFSDFTPEAVHATPFLRYNGVDLFGDEVELTPVTEEVGGTGHFHCGSEWSDHEWIVPSVPGGGAWSWDIINTLQVGIQLDMVIDSGGHISVMQCTQIYVVVSQIPPPTPDPDPNPDPNNPDPNDPDPDPEPPPPPKPPPVPPPVVCTEGQYKCVGTTRYICESNRWVLHEKFSDACGYVTPPQPTPDVEYKGITEVGKTVHDGVDEEGHMADDGLSSDGMSIKEHFTT